MRGEDMITARAEIGVATRRPKTGGRKKGTPNKRTVERQQLLATVRASGKDPISFFSDVLQNETAPLELRFQAAKELAPYVHPKLTSIEARAGGMGHEERLEMLNAMLADAKAEPNKSWRESEPDLDHLILNQLAYWSDSQQTQRLLARHEDGVSTR